MPDDNFTVTGQRNVARFDPDQNEVVRGWWVRYRDLTTNVASEVFVPETEYPNAVRMYIHDQMRGIRHVAGLGTPKEF